MEIHGRKEGDKERKMIMEQTLTANQDQLVKAIDRKGILYIGPQWWVYQHIWETDEFKDIDEENKSFIRQYFL